MPKALGSGESSSEISLVSWPSEGFKKKKKVIDLETDKSWSCHWFEETKWNLEFGIPNGSRNVSKNLSANRK